MANFIKSIGSIFNNKAKKQKDVNILIETIFKFEEDDWDKAFVAAKELGKIGSIALPRIFEEIDKTNRSLTYKKLLVFAIGEIGDPIALHHLARITLSNTDDFELSKRYLKLFNFHHEDQLLGLAIEVNEAYKKIGLSANDALQLVKK